MGVSKHEMGVSHWVGAAAVCLPAMLGCTELDFEDDNCVSLQMEPCSAAGGSAGSMGSAGTAGTSAIVEAPGWECVGDPPPVHDLPPLEGIAYVVPILDFADPRIIPPNLDIEVCLLGDLNCTSPITAGLPPITQPDPVARPFLRQIILPGGPTPFQGYLRLTADGYLPTDYYFGGPIIGNPENPEMPNVIVGQLIGMPRVSYIDDFFSQLSDEPRNLEAGLLALRVLNCDNARSAGVQLDLTNETALGWTIRSAQPANDEQNPNATLATDDLGIAGFANVRAPRNVIVDGVLPDDRRYGTHAWPIRANRLTLAEVRTDYSYGR